MRLAHEEGWIEEPVTVRRPALERKRTDVLIRGEVERALCACGGRDRALLATLIDPGLRRGGALVLGGEDVDLHAGAVHARSGKGGEARVSRCHTG